MIDMNRLAIARNGYQGSYKRVLTVCSGGVLRAPTAAWVLGQEPYNYNTRAAGIESYALVRVDEALVHWADEVVFMMPEHLEHFMNLFPRTPKPSVVLNIPDRYAYRDAELVRLIKQAYEAETKDG